MRRLLTTFFSSSVQPAQTVMTAAASGRPHHARAGCRLPSHLLFVLSGLFAFLSAATIACANPHVNVQIHGTLSDNLRQNINGSLSLTRLDNKEPLTKATFLRMYDKTRAEAARALQPFGYYDPTISISQQQVQPDTWQVVLNVDPGPPTLVTKVEITVTGPGAEDTSTAALIRDFPLHQGNQLNDPVYEQGKDQLITRMLDKGYNRAYLSMSRVEVRKRDYSAKIILKVDTGPRYVIGPIAFKADFLSQSLLQKITPVHEGDPLSPKALTRMRQSLYDAGYFSEVNIKYNLDDASPDTHKVPVTVLLKPDLAHKYGIGLGYGTDTGPRATLAYTNRHINSLGHQLTLQWQPAQYKSSFSGVYSIPIGDPDRDRLSLTSSYATEEFDNTKTETFSNIISADHVRSWGDYSTFFQILKENYSTGAVGDEGNVIYALPGIKGSLFWADDRINTTRGLRLSASVKGSKDGFAADSDFLQANINLKVIYQFWDKWKIIGRTDLGSTLVGDISALPPSLRYYAGGDESVRGYGYKKIGPTDGYGNILGGKNLFVYSIELDRVLFGKWSGAVFYDSGATGNSFADLTMQSGAGVGIRWSGVFGQIRLDLAKSLDDGNSWRIHLTMGADL